LPVLMSHHTNNSSWPKYRKIHVLSRVFSVLLPTVYFIYIMAASS